jgi:hypothetical protein
VSVLYHPEGKKKKEKKSREVVEVEENRQCAGRWHQALALWVWSFFVCDFFSFSTLGLDFLYQGAPKKSASF